MRDDERRSEPKAKLLPCSPEAPPPESAEAVVSGLRRQLAEARAQAEAARLETVETMAQMRDANERLVLATLRAHELAEAAEVAKVRAEEDRGALAHSEEALRREAGFRERLIGIVGHDLRNPLLAVAMSASALQLQGLGPASQVTVGRIVESVGRMRTMISQLLDFSRAQLGGGLPVVLEPMELVSVLTNVLNELERGHGCAGAFQLEVVGVGAEASSPVTGLWDRCRLEQVFSNLAGNALEHREPGTPVKVRVCVLPRDEVQIAIQNSGEAIPSELIPELFKPFVRGPESQRSREGSLGLGLFIASEIVRLHGGTLSGRVRPGGNHLFGPAATHAASRVNRRLRERPRHHPVLPEWPGVRSV